MEEVHLEDREDPDRKFEPSRPEEAEAFRTLRLATWADTKVADHLRSCRTHFLTNGRGSKERRVAPLEGRRTTQEVEDPGLGQAHRHSPERKPPGRALRESGKGAEQGDRPGKRQGKGGSVPIVSDATRCTPSHKDW